MTGYDLGLIAALLAQGGIAMLLLLMLGAVRVPLVMRGKVHLGDIALSREPWPEHEKRVSNAFDNQFQLPVLFYVAGALSLYFDTIWIELVVAWLFVATRVVHAGIFVTTNNVIHRSIAYSIGFALLGFFWLELLVRLGFIAIWNRA